MDLLQLKYIILILENLVSFDNNHLNIVYVSYVPVVLWGVKILPEGIFLTATSYIENLEVPDRYYGTVLHNDHSDKETKPYV